MAETIEQSRGWLIDVFSVHLPPNEDGPSARPVSPTDYPGLRIIENRGLGFIFKRSPSVVPFGLDRKGLPIFRSVPTIGISSEFRETVPGHRVVYHAFMPEVTESERPTLTPVLPDHRIIGRAGLVGVFNRQPGRGQGLQAVGDARVLGRAVIRGGVVGLALLGSRWTSEIGPEGETIYGTDPNVLPAKVIIPGSGITVAFAYTSDPSNPYEPGALKRAPAVRNS